MYKRYTLQPRCVDTCLMWTPYYNGGFSFSWQLKISYIFLNQPASYGHPDNADTLSCPFGVHINGVPLYFITIIIMCIIAVCIYDLCFWASLSPSLIWLISTVTVTAWHLFSVSVSTISIWETFECPFSPYGVLVVVTMGHFSATDSSL